MIPVGTGEGAGCDTRRDALTECGDGDSVGASFHPLLMSGGSSCAAMFNIEKRDGLRLEEGEEHDDDLAQEGDATLKLLQKLTAMTPTCMNQNLSR